MKFKLYLVVILFFSVSKLLAQGDSLIVSFSKELPFIQHQVAAKQTIFRIAKHYHLSQVALKVANKLTSDSIALNRTLIIPLSKSNFCYDTSQVIKTLKDYFEKVYYYPTPEEKLSDICQKFHTPITYIKRMNGLEKLKKQNNFGAIQVGFIKLNSIALRAPDPKSSNEPILSITNTSKEPLVSSPKSSKEPETTVLMPTPKKTLKDSVVITDSSAKLIITNKTQLFFQKLYNSKSNLVEETEKGPAIWMSTDSTETPLKGFYGLSNTIITGTIVKVTNPMSSKSVFIKIIGKIPDILGNQRCILKLSEESSQAIEAFDNRFLVELTYHLKE